MDEIVIKGILIVSGTFFLGLGIIGIFIPLLPTTPFLLLAAACYARGSKRCYNWLLNNKLLGEHIKNYREGKGIPVKGKIISIAVLWITIIFSSFLMASNYFIQTILFIIAVFVTMHIVTIRTLKKNG